MNPQYFSQQQYGAPFQNDGQNNQGFENIPLVSSNSNNTPLNVPPSSVSSSNPSPQLNNLLGKMPSSNLGPFTVLPQGQKTPGSDIHNQNMRKDFAGVASKSVSNFAADNSSSNGSVRNLQSRTLNSSSDNGSVTSGFSIPPSQLPPGTYQSKPSGPPVAQIPSSASAIQQSSTPPNRAQTPNLSTVPQNNQVPKHTSFHPSSPLTSSQIPSNPATPQIGSNNTSQNPSGAPGQSLPAPTSVALQPPTSQYNPSSNPLDSQATIGNESKNPFMQSSPINSTQSTLENQKIPAGMQQNHPFGGSPNLPQSGPNMPPRNPQSPDNAQDFQATSVPFPPTGKSPFYNQQQLNQAPLQTRPPLPGQPVVSNQLFGQASRQQPSHEQQSLQGQTPMAGQPPLPGQAQFTGQSTLPGKFPGQPPLPMQFPGQPPLPGQLPGQPPLPGQLPGQPPLPGQLLGQPQLPGQVTAPPPMAGQLPGQPPLPGQQFSGPPMLSGQQPVPGQQLSSQQPLSNQYSYGRQTQAGQTGGRPPMASQQPFPPPSVRQQGQQSYGGPQQYNQNSSRNMNSPYAPSTNLPTQYQNQLSNQMQNMNVSGNPQNGASNGEMSPHMPPPPQSQQMKNPSGYPPMQGQQPTMTPGYPPQPGYPQPGYQQHGYPQPGFQQQNQQRRLDPDQMPSPIQVTTDDQNNRSGVFITNQRGLMPPLVTTNFVVQDQGNCSPRFIRSSMYNVATTSDMMKSTAVPFSLVISPLARTGPGEYSPPIVNFGELGPVRCVRCKAYMCPYMTFVDSGRRFQCAFCKATTDVPAEYFQHLDHTGQRMDRFERAELVLGTYEFMATADYCKTNTLPKVPAVIFIIDVSYNSMKSGLVRLLCSQMKEIIRNLPVDEGEDASKMKVGFITYDSTVHFYNIKGTLAAPQMLVVGDTHEIFMPLLDGFLSRPEESEVIIDALMEQIPNMFGGTRQTETILLPAILAGVEALKASECAGKLMVFSSNLPSVDAPGKLKNRDDRKLLGTDKERTILTPQNQAYNQLGQDCVQAGVSVDLFLFNNSYIDIATIGQVSRLTGGEVFKYTYFQADIDGERLIQDIITDISRPIGFDAVMRVRTSTGIRPTEFYGHFYMSNTTDMELASIDCDKAVAIEIKHDDKLHEDDGVFIQAALLYTSCSGQRRLRICNLSLKTCSQMTDLYRSCDLDTLINYWSKQSLFKLMDHNPKAVKDNLVTKAAQVLATYRKHCATPSSAGQLILPECMKLLPLYVNCLLKSDAISGGSDMTVDERSFVMQACMTMDVPTSVYFFYPRLIPIHDLDGSSHDIPPPIRCSIEKMTDQGVYLLENGIHMFMWIGLGANPEFIQKLFGVPSAIQVNIEQFKLPELDNPVSLAVRNIIEEIRIQRHRHMRLTLVRQREKLEPVFKHFLVEDKGIDGSPSYVDFLCHMHKEIRNLLS
ncbi:protein transport protein Sec24C isoform X2 [Coccinella septempunctata]|uniref:protein transport protein Sec24C isoform X2 n=1 Tax=Coccinella septempunctata TaxID=41139 RepID=UPI001D06D34F|nr:protein transport protein Sec24C isoform X2 [Coccinella septempunctata]